MMKTILKFSLLLLVVITTAVSAQQKTKLGHIDSNELLLAMPGRDSAKAKLETHAQALETQLKTMSQEYETKMQDYKNKQGQMTDLIKQTKEQEIMDLQQRIQDFQKTAQDDLQKKEQTLMSPIIDKAKKAIEDCAKENAYTYVFDSSVGVLLYFDKGDDLMPLVKKKLGIVK